MPRLMAAQAWQRVALERHCRLAAETADPVLSHRDGSCSVVLSVMLSVNSGYE